MKTAVCAIVQKDKEILMISRGENLEDWNLPGGKLEDGENIFDAVERELLEETGLRALRIHLPIYKAICHGEIDFMCHTFIVIPENYEIRSSAEGRVRWGKWEEILTDKCSFRDYNKKLYEIMSAT